ncbi:MAG TPA: hypothetical protein VHE14_05645 [Solirubrobacteraceae bacterium]|nr:hypothetical protein [Solirubrobacteraceae bacterium]
MGSADSPELKFGILGPLEVSGGPALQPFSRRAFMQRAGAITAAAALPAFLMEKGWLAEAQAAETDYTRDTFAAVLAFILPGNDDYSIAQGESAPGPGGVGSGALTPFLQSVDEFVPVSAAGAVNTSLPISGGVATVLNQYALQVNPAAAGGSFLSPFARLSFREKAQVFQRFEADATASAILPALQFVSGILPGFVSFLVCSEAGMYDPSARRLTGTPVSWALSAYGGPAEGHAELKGYFQDRKAVDKGSVVCDSASGSRGAGGGRGRCSPTKRKKRRRRRRRRHRRRRTASLARRRRRHRRRRRRVRACQTPRRRRHRRRHRRRRKR